MATLTNNHRLSESWVKAVQDTYKKEGDYSATQLVAPVQIGILKERYNDKIVEDVIDKIWILLGNSVHYILEHSNTEGAITEKRFHAEVLGKDISGQLDRMIPVHNAFGDLEGYKIRDYKVTSAWSVKHGCKDDWEKQQNIYRYLAEKNGYNILNMSIEALLRDWSIKEKYKHPDYPDHQVKKLEVPTWSMEATEEYISNRIRLFESSRCLPDEELPECSTDERWIKEKGFAVVFADGKTKGNAVPGGAKFETRALAEGFKRDKERNPKNKRKVEVVFRTGEATRCEYYCPVKDFCAQYQKTQQDPF